MNKIYEKWLKKFIEIEIIRVLGYQAKIDHNLKFKKIEFREDFIKYTTINTFPRLN